MDESLLSPDREPSLWERKVAADPGHSDWYVRRFRKLAEDGVDIVGEARLIDAMLARGSRVMDAGCGPGRVGGYLHSVGHEVVGVDVDPVLIAAAEQDYPGPRWLVGDLSRLDLPDRFDVIVCAGNVMAFLAPATRGQVLSRLAAHLADAPDDTPGWAGRLVIGFGAGRGYSYREFADDVRAAGLVFEHRFATWDLRPYAGDSDFLVAVLARASAS